MTVTYTAEVATSTFSCFLKLLARWRGSIYKLLWRDFALFAFIYFTLSFLYRFVFNEDQRRVFELIARYCESKNSLIPVAFILGFYVTLIMTRYWNALGHIPWPDHMALFVTANVQGLDERSRMMRRTMLRYLCLAYTITMAAICPTVKKRFPTLKHMVDAGLLTTNEMNSLDRIHTPHNKFFIPLAWTTRLVNKARKERRIEDEFALKTLIDEINQFRMHLATLFVYDWITVPLVYTQVVTVAVYMFFLACLMGRQFLADDPNVPDMYFPLFTFLEYFFYMGWLKVAECLVNPFGEDEDDFDVNFLIDRNLQVSYIIVDEVYNEPPDLVRDQYWGETHFEMPYTAAAEPFRKQPHLGSAVDISKSARDLSAQYREEMDTIEEADSLDEIEQDDAGVGNIQPSHSLFQSPMAVGSSVLRRLFSRQDSYSYGRSNPAEHGLRRKGSRGSSVVGSMPKPIPHPGTDELQFHMEYENPETDGDDNRLIEKTPQGQRRKGTEAIPMSKMKSASPPHQYGAESGQLTPPVHIETAGTSTEPHLPAEPLRLPQENQKPENTEDRGRQETEKGESKVPTMGKSTSPLSSSSPPEQEMIDFTRKDVAPEIPSRSPDEPLSPTSPETASPVWVLASSRFSLSNPTETNEASKQGPKT